MAEYIDKAKLIEAMYHESFEKDSELQRWDSGCWIRYKLFENVVESIAIADVRPIVKGHFGTHRSPFTAPCSECGTLMNTHWNYCPNCGAWMYERGDYL